MALNYNIILSFSAACLPVVGEESAGEDEPSLLVALDIVSPLQQPLLENGVWHLAERSKDIQVTSSTFDLNKQKTRASLLPGKCHCPTCILWCWQITKHSPRTTILDSQLCH